MVLYDVRSEKDPRIVRVARIVEVTGPKNPYHNHNHALDVAGVSQEYCLEGSLDERQRVIAVTAGLTHDLIHYSGRADNESETAKKLRGLLPSLGYDLNSEVEPIIASVLATNPLIGPKNLLEQITVDADMDNLGREDFFEKGALLRSEAEMSGVNYSDRAWLIHSLNFLRKHQYHTWMAKDKRNHGKSKNLAELLRRISL